MSKVDYNNAQKSLTVTYTAPASGNYTGIKFLYSKNSSFSTYSTKTILKSNVTGSTTITGLDAGTKYFVKAETYFSTESNKAVSIPKSAYTMPTSVSNLWSDEWGTNWLSIDLTDRPTNEYSGYNIYYKLSTESDSAYRKANTNLVSKTKNYYYIGESEDGNIVTPGRTYNIKVVTVINDTENNVVLTNDVVAPTCSVTLTPETVTNLTAKKVSDTSMQLTWTAPSGYYDGYNIYYSTSSSKPSSPQVGGLVSSSTSRSITSLTSKGYYYIWVETYVGSYNSSSRSYVTSSTRCSLALDAVSGLGATAMSPSEVKLTWTNLTDSTAYDGLEIYRKKDGEAENQYVKIYTPSKTATSYSNTGLEPNVFYNYKVVTYKGTGSTRLTAETFINRRTYSSSVTNFSATVKSYDTIALSWTPPAESSYKQIKIYRDSTLVTTLSKGASSYNVTGLAGQTSYTFYVKTTNDSGYLSNSYPAGASTSNTLKNNYRSGYRSYG